MLHRIASLSWCFTRWIAMFSKCHKHFSQGRRASQIFSRVFNSPITTISICAVFPGCFKKHHFPCITRMSFVSSGMQTIWRIMVLRCGNCFNQNFIVVAQMLPVKTFYFRYFEKFVHTPRMVRRSASHWRKTIVQTSSTGIGNVIHKSICISIIPSVLINKLFVTYNLATWAPCQSPHCYNIVVQNWITVFCTMALKDKQNFVVIVCILKFGDLWHIACSLIMPTHCKMSGIVPTCHLTCC